MSAAQLVDWHGKCLQAQEWRPPLWLILLIAVVAVVLSVVLGVLRARR